MVYHKFCICIHRKSKAMASFKSVETISGCTTFILWCLITNSSLFLYRWALTNFDLLKLSGKKKKTNCGLINRKKHLKQNQANCSQEHSISILQEYLLPMARRRGWCLVDFGVSPGDMVVTLHWINYETHG